MMDNLIGDDENLMARTVRKLDNKKTPLEELICIKNTWDVFELDACYDRDTQELVFKAVVPNNTWFSIGFGESMTNTDMIGWFVKDKAGSNVDYWSTSQAAPVEDTTSDLTEDRPAAYDEATDKMTFVTRRLLDTGDTEQDFLVKLNVDQPMMYAYRKSDSDWQRHDFRTFWSLNIQDVDGEVKIADAGLDITELLRNYEFEAHGWWMWGSWYIIGILLLATKRYFK